MAGPDDLGKRTLIPWTWLLVVPGAATLAVVAHQSLPSAASSSAAEEAGEESLADPAPPG
jgi:hypothetical protein